jgi:ribokinase
MTRDHIERLMRSRDVQWIHLRSASFFKRIADATRRAFSEVALDYFAAVAKRLPQQQRWVVAYTLALDVAEVLPKSRTGDVTARRKAARAYLRDHAVSEPSFGSIHDADATYRKYIEDPTLEAFAKLLDQPTEADLAALGADISAFGDLLTASGVPLPSEAHVVVLGSAVMDLNFRIPVVPDIGGSVQALNFKPFPGGKGLTQAVACARLGLHTSLVSVLGDDRPGPEGGDPYTLEILHFLKEEDVDISMVARRMDETAPVTAVFTLDRPAGSFAIGWKNDENLLFGPRNLHEEGRDDAISSCQYFLTSFELSSATVGEALAIAKKGGATTIVTPAPPYEKNVIDPSHYKKIDFMVANTWELEEFARLAHREVSGRAYIDALAKPLIAGPGGLRNLLVVHERQCNAYVRAGTGRKSELQELQTPSWPTKDRESAGDRDAFCAMLAKQLHLIDSGTPHSLEHAVYWAAAAMARAGGELSVPDSMPYFDEVVELVKDQRIEIPD